MVKYAVGWNDCQAAVQLPSGELFGRILSNKDTDVFLLCRYLGLTTDLRIQPSANWVQLWRYQLPFASSTTMVAPW